MMTISFSFDLDDDRELRRHRNVILTDKMKSRHLSSWKSTTIAFVIHCYVATA